MKEKLLKLEMMRGFAAVYVMIDHLLHYFSPVSGAQAYWLLLPFHFGQEAVMLFFLISGFVIFLSTERQHSDFPTYLSKRWRRIYPIFLLTLLLCAVDLVAFKGKGFRWRVFWGNIFMLQDWPEAKPGVWFKTLDGNSPLWSLAYEWWFYLLFYPIWRYVGERAQRWVAVGISFAGLLGFILGPNQICLYLWHFILWWTGAELARQYNKEARVTFSGQRTTLAVLGAFTVLTVAGVMLAQRLHPWTPPAGPSRFTVYPLMQIRDFAACCVIVTSALIWRRCGWRWFDALFGGFVRVAPISYGIYALHYLIAVSSNFFTFIPMGVLKLFIVTTVAIATAWFAERPFQNFVNRWTDFLPDRKRPKTHGYSIENRFSSVTKV